MCAYRRGARMLVGVRCGTEKKREGKRKGCWWSGEGEREREMNKYQRRKERGGCESKEVDGNEPTLVVLVLVLRLGSVGKNWFVVCCLLLSSSLLLMCEWVGVGEWVVRGESVARWCVGWTCLQKKKEINMSG